jgi:transcription-repair coupling factor (superfamily II helicase)
VREARERDPLLRFTGLRGASNRVAASHLIRAHGERTVVYVTPHSRAADSAIVALRGFLGEREGESRIRSYPRHDTLPFDRFSPQPFLVSQRMEVLHRLDQARLGTALESAPIIVAPRSALSLRVPSRKQLQRSTRRLSVGESLDRDVLVARLVGLGYQRMALVEEPGEVAVRGDIIDVFPPQLATPIRIELWGDEVDSIRSFDPASQRSQTKSSTVLLPPPRELLFDREGVIDRSDMIRARAREQGVDTLEIDDLIGSLLRGHVPAGAEALAPLIQSDMESFFDYLPPDTLVLLEEPEEGEARLEQIFGEIESNHGAAVGERLTVPLSDLLLDPDTITDALRGCETIKLERLDILDSLDATDAPDGSKTGGEGGRRFRVPND